MVILGLGESLQVLLTAVELLSGGGLCIWKSGMRCFSHDGLFVRAATLYYLVLDFAPRVLSRHIRSSALVALRPWSEVVHHQLASRIAMVVAIAAVVWSLGQTATAGQVY